MMKKTLFIHALVFSLLLCGCGSGMSEEQKALRDSGIEKLASNDYDGAAADFNSALDLSHARISRDMVDIVYYMAATDVIVENYDSAVERYSDLLEFDKDNADAYFLRGSVYLLMDEVDAGLSDYHSAVECDEKDYERYLEIYSNLDATGYKDEAKEFLNMALEVEGDKANNYYYRGRIYLILDQMDVAETAFSKSLDKGNDEAGIYLARIYLDQGEDARARDLISGFTEEKNKSPEKSALAGQLLLALGEYDEALATYSQAIKSLGDDRDDASRRDLLKGQISAYEFTGDFSSARELAAEYVSEYPADGRMIRELEFLKTR